MKNNFLADEYDEEIVPDYENMWAVDLQDLIEKGFEEKMKKNTIKFKEHRKKVNQLVDIYNRRFGKTYIQLK